MGNQQSINNSNNNNKLQSQTAYFSSQYQLIINQNKHKKIDITHINSFQNQDQLKVIQNKNNHKQYLLKQWTSIQKQDIQSIQKKIHKKTKYTHQNILQIISTFKDEYHGLCGNRFMLYAIIQKPQKTLQEQYQNRKNIQRLFTQQQLWKIAYQVTSALIHSQRNNTMLNTLSMKDIYIDSQFIKIIDPHIVNFTGDLSSKQLVIRKLGAILLQLGLMYKPKSISSLYCNKLNNNYSSFFTTTVNKIINNYITLQGIQKYAQQGITSTVSNHTIHLFQHQQNKNQYYNTCPKNYNDFSNNSYINNSNNRNSNSSIRQNNQNSFRALQTIQQTLSRKPKSLYKGSPNSSNIKSNSQNKSPNTHYTHYNTQRAYQNNNYYYEQSPHSQYNTQRSHYNNYCYQEKQNNYKKQSPFFNQQINQKRYLETKSPAQNNKLKNHQSQKAASLQNRNIINKKFENNQKRQIKAGKKVINLKKKPSVPYMQQISTNQESNNNIRASQYQKQQNTNIYRIYDKKKQLCRQYRPTRQCSYGKTDYIGYSQSYQNQDNIIQIRKKIQNQIKSYNSSSQIQESQVTEEQSEQRNIQLAIPQLKNRINQVLNSQQVKNNGTILQVQESQWISQASRSQKNLVDFENEIDKRVNQKIKQSKQVSKRQSYNSSQNGFQYVMQQYDGGSRYQGYKKNGHKQGIGKLCYQDGGMYQGQWKNDQMNGFGKLYYQNGKLAYEGYWKNNQFHGQGRIVNDQASMIDNEGFDYRNFNEINDGWICYEGQFYQDIKRGQGILRLSNGQVMQGNWNDNCVDGAGVFYTTKGQVIRGIWRQNILVQLIDNN